MRRLKFKDNRSVLVLLTLFLLASVAYAVDEGAFHYQSEDDYDDDTILDDDDVCPLSSDAKQWDVDEDGVGDACDNCAGQANASQSDLDGDLLGDACDVDRDADAVYNTEDLCPDVFDEGQGDADTDSVGDACDTDIDGDGTANLSELCPYAPGVVFSGPECNRDADTDSVPDFDLSGAQAVWDDNCPFLANSNQEDLDSDGSGDVCDPDVDGDSVADGADNCPVDANEEQADGDRDGIGDVCDDAFCYVVLGDEENCLDPSEAFFVYTPPVTGARTGDQLLLRLFANREDAELEYSWRVRSAPETTDVANSNGTVVESTPFEYRYAEGAEASFAPLLTGTYVLELTATEVETGESSSAQATFFVEGTDLSSGDNCNCRNVGTGTLGSHPSLWAALLMLVGVVVLRRSIF